MLSDIGWWVGLSCGGDWLYGDCCGGRLGLVWLVYWMGSWLGYLSFFCLGLYISIDLCPGWYVIGCCGACSS